MAEKTMTLEVICPERVFYKGPATMVEYNTTEGEVGVYPGHIPMTQIIAPGELIITEEGEQKHAALMSGFVQITEEAIVILAEAVEWPEEIDVNRAQEAKRRAERRLGGEEGADVKRAELALKRALLRIAMAEKK